MAWRCREAREKTVQGSWSGKKGLSRNSCGSWAERCVVCFFREARCTETRNLYISIGNSCSVIRYLGYRGNGILLRGYPCRGTWKRGCLMRPTSQLVPFSNDVEGPRSCNVRVDDTSGKFHRETLDLIALENCLSDRPSRSTVWIIVAERISEN